MAKPLIQFLAPLVAAAVAGCGAVPDSTASTDDLLAPPEAGQGIQLRMTTTIAAGQEIERCRFFVVPPGGVNLSSEKTRYRAGSHHVLLFTTSYASIPVENVRHEPIATQEVFDCPGGVIGSWNVTGVAAGSQDPNSPPLVLPPGVAVRLSAGAVLLMNTHYVNASAAPVQTDTRMNIYSVPDSEVREEAGVFLLYDPFIRVPAMGSSRARMRCPVPSDIKLVTLTSHMHRRGVGFGANLVDALGNLQEMLFETAAWENVPTAQWLPVKAIPAGAAFDFHCDYKNSEDRVVAQGATTRDEMCALIGVYYPRDPRIEACSAAGFERPDRDATWIGNGKLACGEALSCVSSATDTAGVYGCVVDSCPASAPALSAFLHCQDSATRGAEAPCAAVCPLGAPPKDAAACRSCLFTQCGSQITACLSGSC